MYIYIYIGQNLLDGHKTPMTVATIMMKCHSIKEFIKGTHNDTQHQNSAQPNTSPIDCDAADQCTMSHGTYIHIVI